MADDITIKYGSTGFEKVKAEALEIEKRAHSLAQMFTPMKNEAKEAEQSVGSLFTKLEGGASRAVSGLGSLALGVTTVATAAAGLFALVGGAGVAAFTAWGHSVLKTTEGFRQMEISLYGALKSWDKVETVSKFAKEYAAEYPAMYGDVMRAMQSLAFIPSLKPALMKGDVDQMKEFMHVVQGMMTMRPEQGVTGSIWALREALAGNWRSLQMRFDVPIRSIAKSANMTMEEMKENPQQAMKALKAWIDEFVGADTMALSAKNLSIQIGNLKDKYDIWIDKLGKSGIYQKVVDYLLRMNDALQNFLASDKMEKWTTDLNAFLESIADKIAGIFTKGINWENIGSLGELVAAIKKVGENAVEELKNVWAVAKDPLANAMKGAFKFAAEVAMEALKEVVWPGIKGVVTGLEGSMKGFRKQSPLGAAAVEFGTGAVIGGAIAGPTGAAVGGVAAVALQGYAEIIGLITEKGAEFIGAVDTKVKEWRGIKKEDLGAGPSEETKADVKRGTEILDETRKILQLPWLKNEGIRAQWGLKPLEGVNTEEARKKNKFPNRFPFVEEEEAPAAMAPFRPSGEQMLSRYSAWARMAGMLASKEEVNPYESSASFQFATGKMNYQQYQKAQKMEQFTGERETQLKGVLGVAEGKKDYGLQSKVYGEMFNIAYQKGDFGKAQEYMNKSLDLMLKQMEKEEKRGEEDNKNIKTIADYAVVAKKSIEERYRVEPGKYSNITGDDRAQMDDLRKSVMRDQVE